MRTAQKQNAVIWMAPYRSHFICAFSFAEALQADYNVILIGSSSFSEMVTSQGWQFRAVPSKFLHPQVTVNGFLSRVLERFIRSPFNEFLYECQEISSVLKGLDPVLIFVDAHLSRYYPVLKELDAKVVTLQPMLSGRKAKGVPPLTSTYKPSPRRVSHVYTELLWVRFFFQKALIRFFFNLLSVGINQASLMRKMPHYDKTDYDFKRAGPPGLVHCHEIYLYSSLFEFPWKESKPNEHYFGLAVHRARKEQLNAQIQEYLYRIKGDRQANLIYCSLGFIPAPMIKQYRDFLLKLSDIVNLEDKWFFLIVAPLPIEANSDRILFTPHAPQLKILEYAHAAITAD